MLHSFSVSATCRTGSPGMLLVFFFFLSAVAAGAQEREAWYDVFGNPCPREKACFISIYRQTDSGWLRMDYFAGNRQLQMSGLYEDSTWKIKNGHFSWYYANGIPEQKCRYVQNQPDGLLLTYHSNGMMMDSAHYARGRRIGTAIGWHRNGMVRDSMTCLNDSMMVQVKWFKSGQPAEAGIWLNGKKHGKWIYFHANGHTAMTESLDHGRQTDVRFFDEAGKPELKDSAFESPPQFKDGLEDWKAYLNKNLYWPDQYTFKNGSLASVMAALTIDEEGRVDHAEIVTPFHPAFDAIALKIIRNAKGWKPAIRNNRRIAYTYLQPVSFQQPE